MPAMALLHSMVIAPPPLPAASLPHRRQRLWDEITSVLGPPPPKKWRPGVPDDAVLPGLSADTGEEDILGAARMMSDDIATDVGLPAPKKRCAGASHDGKCLALPHVGDDSGGEDILDEGPCTPKRQRLCAADDGDCIALPHLGDEGREDIVDEGGGMLSTEEEDANPTPNLWWLPPSLELDLGSAYIPKEGEHPDGEDAHFLSEPRNAFGIADGVGGWTSRGVDAGQFARQFMRFCEGELEHDPRGSAITSTWLLGVLERALARTTTMGSSTALIAAIDGRVLRAVNIGDSRFLVVRREKVVYCSPLHQRRFNRPNQVGGVDRRDPPECAVRLEVEIEPGDVIVAGSDGLFDNLFDEYVEDAVAKALVDGHGAPEVIARELAWAAVDAYEGGQATPFTATRSEAGWPKTGGKPDDITVVVARVR